jgi:hypothetical protein
VDFRAGEFRGGPLHSAAAKNADGSYDLEEKSESSDSHAVINKNENNNQGGV